MTSRDIRAPQAAEAGAQDRPTPATSARRVPLGTRLAFFVALSVAAVVTVLTLAGTRIARRQIVGNLRETAQVTAVGLADDIELRQEPWSADALMPALRDFMNAGADLRSISVFRAEQGSPVLVVSTSIVAAPPDAVVRQVMATGAAAWSETMPHTAMIVVPIQREEAVTGAVAVAVSLAGVEQWQRATGLVAAGGGVFAIGAITLLIHLLARRLVLDPLSEIHRVTTRARHGDLGARAQVTSVDELREVADGLNAMLADLDDLHRSLRERVAAATAELRERNEQLVRSYESVSQLRDAAARAQQMAAVGQTVANVAHQIGTPLNLISAHVQLLAQETVDPATRRRLRIVEEQARRMASTVRELLDRTKPDAERGPVRIGRVLTTIAEAMRIRLAGAGVTLDLQIDEQLPAVVANEAQLELALVNLVVNALDAMPQGGTLTLAADRAPHAVRVRVRDTGSGIAAEVLERIFEPWVTTKAAGHGSGLGLSITREVVHALGGAIVVSSRPGESACFTITLPAVEPLQEVS